MNEYEKQAKDFLEKTNTDFSVEYLKHDKYFPDDKDKRDIYEVTLKRGEREYTFTFGQSLEESGFGLRNVRGQKLNFEWDNENRDVKKFKMLAGQKFGTLNKIQVKTPQEPTEYDVLASLTKYNPDTFDNFCASYGYDTDSITAKKIYEAVKEEWLNIERLFNAEEMEELREIQ